MREYFRFDELMVKAFVDYNRRCRKAGGGKGPTLYTSTITKIRENYFIDLRSCTDHVARYSLKNDEIKLLTPFDHDIIVRKNADHEEWITLAIIAYEHWCQEMGIQFSLPSLSMSYVNPTLGINVIELFDRTTQLLAQYEWNEGQLQYLPFVSISHNYFIIDDFYDED